MKKLFLITALLVFGALAVLIAQPGQGHGGGFGQCRGGGFGQGMGGGFGKGVMGKIPGYNFYVQYMEELKLDDSQLDKLQKINESFENERIDMQAKIKHARLELKNELGKKSINKDEILKKQDVVLNLKNSMQKRALTFKLDLNGVLSADQKAKIDGIRKDCMKQGMGNRQGGKANCDGQGRGPGFNK